MTKSQKLQKLALQLGVDNPTPKLAEQASRLVFGSGNPDADVLFIGEAPGRQEDETGEPFVGASGKLLDELLASINLLRKDVYITNIVKYRPPNNRDPLPAEKTAMWPYLISQISIIKPQVLVTLGRHSGIALLPDLKIGEHHGQPKTITTLLENKETEITVLPLYHPAAAIYNRALRQTLFTDFAKLKQLI